MLSLSPSPASSESESGLDFRFAVKSVEGLEAVDLGRVVLEAVDLERVDLERVDLDVEAEDLDLEVVDLEVEDLEAILVLDGLETIASRLNVSTYMVQSTVTYSQKGLAETKVGQ